MHQVLFISEVLREIISHFDDELHDYHKRQKYLAVLARTCKTFYDPAMDSLWAAPHLDSLFACVTRFHSIRADLRAKLLSLFQWHKGIEPMSEHEASQFLRHAARVRKLSIYDDCLHLLTVLPTETCVFPRLVSFSFSVKIPSRCMQLFLSPTLRRFQVKNLNPKPYTKSIGACSATLKHLIINTKVFTISELSLVSEAIRSCYQLVGLFCPLLDSAVWKHLSNLPTLLSLHIDQRNSICTPLDFHLAPFLNLTTLSLYYVQLDDMVSLVEHSEFPSLKVLDVVSYFPAGADKLCRALSQSKARHTLEEVIIMAVREPEDPNISCTAIGLFIGFKQLRFLMLSLLCRFDLDNDLLLEAMSTWPLIRSLELRESHDHSPTVTFRGLFAALPLCPDLHTLEVYVDVQNIDIDPTAESFQHTSLQELQLGSLPVTRAEDVARIIFLMLPGVKNICPGCIDNHYMWDEVNAHLESFRSSAVVGRVTTGSESADQQT